MKSTTTKTNFNTLQNTLHSYLSAKPTQLDCSLSAAVAASDIIGTNPMNQEHGFRGRT